jgi:hypothetical protein
MMWPNVGFILPMMVAVVTAVVTGYSYYRNQQQQLEEAQREYLFLWCYCLPHLES